MGPRPLVPRLILAGAVGVGAIWLALHREYLGAAELEAEVRGLGIWGPLAFVMVYGLGTVLFVPGSALTIAGGALFGPVWGTVWNLAGATLGATLAFLVARYVVSDWVARRTAGRLSRVMRGVEHEGWRFIAFVRLAPVFPFNLLNYALGLTRIRLGPYVVASAVCMLPGAIVYTYVGYAGREAAAASADAIRNGFIALGLLAAIGFLPRLAKAAYRAAGGQPSFTPR